MVKLIFLDTETTGLDPYRHEIWEVGVIVREYKIADNGNSLWPLEDVEHHWFLKLNNLREADLIALNIGKFFDRYDWNNLYDPETFCMEFMYLTQGAYIVGAVPNFDCERISWLMRNTGLTVPAWHYHLVDVETLMAGQLRYPPPWKWRDILADFGIDKDQYDEHTALGDARLARDVYDKVMAKQEGVPLADIGSSGLHQSPEMGPTINEAEEDGS